MIKYLIWSLIFMIGSTGFSQMVDSVGQETQSGDSLFSADSLSSAEIQTVQPVDTVKSKQNTEVDSIKSTEAVHNYSISTPLSLSEDDLKKLHYLEGLWKGEAWIINRNSEKQYVIQTEKVELKQAGRVITIDGTGIDRESLQSKPKVIHDAFAMIYFDKGEQKIKMMAFNQEKRILTEPVISADSSLVWGFAIPNMGKVRYTIRLNEQGQWFEIGEFSQDDVQWFQNFEMTLNRIEL